MEVGEAALGAADPAGGLALGPVVDVDLPAGLGVLGGELLEPALDVVDALDLGADGGVGLGADDPAVVLGFVREAGDAGGVLHVGPPAGGDQAALDVTQRPQIRYRAKVANLTLRAGSNDCAASTRASCAADSNSSPSTGQLFLSGLASDLASGRYRAASPC